MEGVLGTGVIAKEPIGMDPGVVSDAVACLCARRNSYCGGLLHTELKSLKQSGVGDGWLMCI